MGVLCHSTAVGDLTASDFKVIQLPQLPNKPNYKGSFSTIAKRK